MLILWESNVNNSKLLIEILLFTPGGPCKLLIEILLFSPGGPAEVRATWRLYSGGQYVWSKHSESSEEVCGHDKSIA